MRSRILAIPLLAAIWVGSPAYALTPHSDARAITAAVPELVQPMVGVRLDVMTGQVAEQRDRGSRGGGNRGGGNRGDGNRGADRGGQARGGDGDRGRPSGSVARRGDGDRGGSPRVVVVPRRSSPTFVVNNYSSFRRGFYPAYRYDPWIRRSYGWSPVRYAPWGWIYGTAGLASFSIGTGYPYTGYGYYGPDPYYGYGSGYYSGGYYGGRPSTFDTGGVRLKVRPREAQVFVDGYYAGLVNDFDGVFQELRLSQGGHKIEVRMPGFETAYFDVHVQPGRTIDVREDLRPSP